MDSQVVTSPGVAKISRLTSRLTPSQDSVVKNRDWRGALNELLDVLIYNDCSHLNYTSLECRLVTKKTRNIYVWSSFEVFNAGRFGTDIFLLVEKYWTTNYINTFQAFLLFSQLSLIWSIPVPQGFSHSSDVHHVSVTFGNSQVSLQCYPFTLSLWPTSIPTSMFSLPPNTMCQSLLEILR